MPTPVQPDPKVIAKGIREGAKAALRALGSANAGKEAERTGVSERTLNRRNVR